MSADLSSPGTATRLPVETGLLARDLAPLRDGLIARLQVVRTRMRMHFIAEAAARIAATMTALAALTLLLDWWLELSLVARLCTTAVALVAVGYVVHRYLIRPLQLTLAPIDVAAALDGAQNGRPHELLAPRVASVLQLPSHADQPADTSPALIERAVRRSHESLAGVDFRSGLSPRHLLLSIGVLMLAVLAPAAFSLAFPGTSKLWAERWLAGSDRRWPRDTHIEVVGVKDGRIVVPRGEPSSLQVLVTDDEQPTETVWMRMRSEDDRDETVTLTRFADGDFRYELPPLQIPTDVMVWGGDARTDPFQIVPLDRPQIVSLKLTALGPRDTAPTVYTFTGAEGNIRLLPQTQATLEFESNVPVSDVIVETDDGKPLQFTALDERRFSTHWIHTGAVRTRITLTGRDVEFASHPRPISIGEMPDRKPRVSLRHSGVRLRVTPSATIPLTVAVHDDFGIRSVDLQVDLPELTGTSRSDPEESEPDADDQTPGTPSGESDSDGGTPAGEAANPESTGDGGAKDSAAETNSLYGPADPATETSVEYEYNLELEPRQLEPGRLVAVDAVAVDDCVTGEQRSVSRKIVFRVVRPEELFREILLRQQQLRARLRKAADQAENLRDTMQTAVIPDDASALLRTHQLIRREVGHVSRELDASVLEMRLNKLGGEETWQLISKNVLEPLARLYSQEMEQQRLALGSLTGANPDPFEEVFERQQTIVDALSRILDNMAQWDSFIDVVNQLNSVIQLERGVRQKTEELRKTQTESIFDN